MPYQNISASLSDTDIEEINIALQTIEQKLPFLINLSPKERHDLYKMGDKSLAFVNNSLNAAQSNPGILPANFSTEEFERDYQLALRLSELLIRLEQLTEKVDDTLIAVGSEAMKTSLTVYDYVKMASKTTPGLKSVAEQLKERFKGVKTRGNGSSSGEESNAESDE
ncbi:MAG: hypothetical protein RIM23_28175 [Coleofasciculus sp. G3-WIS-01]|uniref:hypothetical protein n=1 Tax=Coleofasciculus sp. G3-WIS-01 TaxID=3069528 RepID=UPI003305195F